MYLFEISEVLPLTLSLLCRKARSLLSVPDRRTPSRASCWCSSLHCGLLLSPPLPRSHPASAPVLPGPGLRLTNLQHRGVQEDADLHWTLRQMDSRMTPLKLRSCRKLSAGWTLRPWLWLKCLCCWFSVVPLLFGCVTYHSFAHLLICSFLLCRFFGCLGGGLGSALSVEVLTDRSPEDILISVKKMYTCLLFCSLACLLWFIWNTSYNAFIKLAVRCACASPKLDYTVLDVGWQQRSVSRDIRF